MRIITFHVWLGTAILGVLVLTACQTPVHSQIAGQSTNVQAVMCPKCQVAWVQGLDLNDPYSMTFQTEEIVVCADCRSAVESFFATGWLEHTCKTCGGALKHCEVHRSIGSR
jgi:hypothetical protein